MNGKISYFNAAKGFGTIKYQVPDGRYFDMNFWHTSLKYSPPQEGDNVTFDKKQGTKGFEAINIQKVA